MAVAVAVAVVVVVVVVVVSLSLLIIRTLLFFIYSDCCHFYINNTSSKIIYIS